MMREIVDDCHTLRNATNILAPPHIYGKFGTYSIGITVVDNDPAIGQSVQRVLDLANLYEDLDRESAMRLIAIWQATTKPAAPSKPKQEHKHEQYLHADSGRPAFPVSRPRIPWDEHARQHHAELSLRDEDVCADPARY